MNSAGVTPQNLQQRWQFTIEIDGFDAAYFTQSGMPEVEFEESVFNPAGSMFPQKTAGRASFSDIEMQKGVPADNPEENILDWIRECANFHEATGGVPSQYMRTVDLVKYDRAGREIQRFRLYNAWVKSARFGEGDGSSSENDIETMTLAYQYFTAGADNR